MIHKSVSPLISVLIPVYNVEPYLRQCLDSVTLQTLRDIEIICVNDGSTDGSLQILGEYANADNRIAVIDKARREGLSRARNTGMAHATGQYMMFLDSDDFIDLELCRKALECATANSADMIIYDFASFRNQRELYANRAKRSDLVGIHPSERSTLLKTEAFAWTKMIRTEYARSVSLQFPIVQLTYEDIPVHWRLITLTPRICILPERLCFYRQRLSSMSYRRDWTLADLIPIHDSIREFLVAANLYEEYRDDFLQTQLDLFRWLHENIDASFRNQMMEVIQQHIIPEHWAYIDSAKPLSWRTRDFFEALRGSKTAKVRRYLWLFSRNLYRGINIPRKVASILDATKR